MVRIGLISSAYSFKFKTIGKSLRSSDLQAYISLLSPSMIKKCLYILISRFMVTEFEKSFNKSLDLAVSCVLGGKLMDKCH